MQNYLGNGLCDIGAIDTTSLTEDELDLLEEIFTNGQVRGSHPMEGSLQSQRHVEVLDWLLKKPGQVRHEFKHAVVLIVNKLTSVYAQKVT